MKKIINIKIYMFVVYLLAFLANANAQQITRAEYFFDSDPGVGNGTPLTVTASDTLENTFSIPVDGLSEGFHQLYLRVAEEDTLWSFFEGRTFYIMDQLAHTSSSQLTGAEYFFDSDPGIGQGTALAVTAGDTISNVFTIDIASLNPGFHQLYIRVKDGNNHWSLFEGRTLYVMPTSGSTTTPALVELEYFIGADPGLGNGTSVTFATTDTIDTDVVIDMASEGLTAGEYTLSMRVKDENGTWSLSESRTFRVCDAVPTAPIVYDKRICVEGTAELAAEGAGAGNYRWYDPDGILISGQNDSSYVTPTLQDSATYFVTALNAEGCESELTPVLAAVIYTTVEAGHNDTLVFATDTVSIEPGLPVDGYWYGNTAVVDSLYFDRSAGAGDYLLTYEVDIDGCLFNDTRTIVVNKAPQTIVFDPIADVSFDQGTVALNAEASSGLPVVFSLVQGIGSITNNTLTLDSVGVYIVEAAQTGNENYLPVSDSLQSFDVTKGTTVIAIDNLVQIYDGSEKQVTVTTEPSGLTTLVTYEGLQSPPTDVGKYPFEVFIDDPYYMGTRKDTLEITKGMATITFSGTAQVYDGTEKSVTATTNPSGLSVTVTYDGAADIPTDAGTYDVAAVIDDANYQGTASTTLEILKADATIAISSTTHVYDGTGKSVTATTNPSGLSVTVTYDGAADLPTDAGTYDVAAVIDDANYQGTASTTLEISKADAEIVITDLEHDYDGSAKEVSVTTSPSGLNYEVTYDNSSTPPSDTGTYDVLVTIIETNYQGTETAWMTITGSSGLNDMLAENVMIYPNPVKNHLKIEFPEGHEVTRVHLTNVEGRILLIRQILSQVASVELKLEGLPQGVYLITFRTEDQYIFSKRIIVIK